MFLTVRDLARARFPLYVSFVGKQLGSGQTMGLLFPQMSFYTSWGFPLRSSDISLSRRKTKVAFHVTCKIKKLKTQLYIYLKQPFGLVVSDLAFKELRSCHSTLTIKKQNTENHNTEAEIHERKLLWELVLG